MDKVIVKLEKIPGVQVCRIVSLAQSSLVQIPTLKAYLKAFLSRRQNP
jgi:hypothetical protein